MLDIPDLTSCKGNKRRRYVKWLLIVLSLFLALLILDYALYPTLVPMGGESGNQGENGLWVRHSWYFGEYSEADLKRLATLLPNEEIRDLYCHVRFIQPDGRLHFRYPETARRFIKDIHREAPDVRILAWIYVGSEQGTPTVDIGDAQIRQRVIMEARWLISECGFDGIQWDYEACRNNDERLITLLKETRQALPPGTFLSVCTPLWLPNPLPRRYGWDEQFFARVAEHCDQLAVMSYDSAIYLPRSYAWLMSQQVVHVTRAVNNGNPHCRVIIGVPTYQEGGASHHPHAENLRVALHGVRLGLADRRSVQRVFAGIAPFAEYTTSEEEWRSYRQYWLEK